MKFAFPSFISSDRELNITYNYRCELYNRHIKETPVGQVISEFGNIDEITAELEANLAEMDAIRKAIKSLDDLMEQEVLWNRYIEPDGIKHMPWRDVALRMYHDDDESTIRAVTRLHGKALESIRKVEI